MTRSTSSLIRSVSAAERACFMDDDAKRIDRVPEQRHVRQVGNDLAQQLQPLAFEVRRDRAQARDVAAGTRQARHDAGAIGSPTAIITSGTVVVARLTASVAGVPAVTISFDFGCEQFGTERGKALVVSFGPAEFDLELRRLVVAEQRARSSRNGPMQIGLELGVELPMKPMRRILPALRRCRPSRRLTMPAAAPSRKMVTPSHLLRPLKSKCASVLRNS